MTPEEELVRLRKKKRLRELEAKMQSQPSVSDPESSGEGLTRLDALAVGDPRLSFIDAGLTAGTGFLASALGGVAGIGASLVPGLDEGVGARTVKNVQEALTFQPRTKQGREFLTNTAEAVTTGINAPVSGLAGIGSLASGGSFDEASNLIEKVQSKGGATLLADEVLDETGSPILATGVFAAPDLIEAALGIKALRSVKAPVLQSKPKQEMVKLIQEGIDDPSTVGFRVAKSIISGKNVLKKNKLAQDALKKAKKQGFDEDHAATIVGTDKATKAKILSMTKHVKDGLKNIKAKNLNVPMNIAGDSLRNRFVSLRSANLKAGRKLKQIVSKESFKKSKVDNDSILQEFSEQLDDLGVTFGDGKLNFKNSSISVSSPAKTAVQNVFDRLATTRSTNPLHLHRTKIDIDEFMKGSTVAEGLKGKAQVSLFKVRKKINDTLSSQFPEYKKTNNVFSETKDVLDRLQKRAGKDVDLMDSRTSLDLGLRLRSIASNNVSQGSFVRLLDDIEKISTKHAKKFSDDLVQQALIADELHKVFGLKRANSLKGQTIDSLPTSKADVVNKTLSAAHKKLFKVNIEEAIKAVETLVKTKPLRPKKVKVKK